MILEVTKIENGLSWNGEDKFFTNLYYENGYEALDPINLTIELNEQIYGMCVETASLDGVMYSTSEEFATAVFR
jgi:hypothetical protein